ncbi:MAG: nuclear transport factor 2 family protein [Gammaproteobacteria bacterium]|jgi:ketosteroid isomerase-like protein|nr:nuclear transport factor 2 family protein [Gammaproteobacteria bacterium]
MNPSATLASLAARLDRLESKDAIRDIVTAYAIACDEHDMPRLMNLFTVDACFDAPNGSMVANGKAAIQTLFEKTFKIRGPAYHWTHDVTLEIDTADPNRGTGLVLSHAETTPNGVVSIAAMRYQDDYRRESDGQWRFAKRVISFLYYVPASDYSQGLNHPDRVVMGGSRLKADYPEALPAWQAFIDAHGPLDLD